jgi:hypothetical protein
LKDIVGACGEQIFSDKVRLQGILADVVSNRMIRKIILLAINDDIHNKLINSKNSDSTIKIETIKYIFSTRNFLYKEPADYIVDSFAYALGITQSINNIEPQKLENWFADTSDRPNFSVYERVKPVEIFDFSVKDKFVFENTPFVIHWKAGNFLRAFINNEEIPVRNNDYVTKISGYKQFVLTVENEHYKDSRTIGVQTVKMPQITEFKSTQTHIKLGEQVVLLWNVSDANRVTVKCKNKEIDVTHKNDLEVTPNNTTHYELIAYTVNDLHTTSKKIKVVVVKPVQILSFKVNKERIFESYKILLEWQVTNATQVLLLPVQKDITGINEIELLPTQTTTYTLQASNEIFTEETNLSVYVHPLPVISKISFPEMPAFNIPVPDLSFDTSYKQTIIKHIEEAAWYNKLFSLQFTAIYVLFNNMYNNITQQISKILNNKR